MSFFCDEIRKIKEALPEKITVDPSGTEWLAIILPAVAVIFAMGPSLLFGAVTALAIIGFAVYALRHLREKEIDALEKRKSLPADSPEVVHLKKVAERAKEIGYPILDGLEESILVLPDGEPISPGQFNNEIDWLSTFIEYGEERCKEE